MDLPPSFADSPRRPPRRGRARPGRGPLPGGRQDRPRRRRPAGFGTPRLRRARCCGSTGWTLVVGTGRRRAAGAAHHVARRGRASSASSRGCRHRCTRPSRRSTWTGRSAVDAGSAPGLAAVVRPGRRRPARPSPPARRSDEPSPITIWPEHFDLALSAAKVNYGASPGDDAIGEPYAYVGPWDRPLPGDATFWNQPFGAALGHDRIAGSDDLVGLLPGRQGGRRTAAEGIRESPRCRSAHRVTPKALRRTPIPRSGRVAPLASIVDGRAPARRGDGRTDPPGVRREPGRAVPVGAEVHGERAAGQAGPLAGGLAAQHADHGRDHVHHRRHRPPGDPSGRPAPRGQGGR